MKKDHPIIMSAPMVRALMEGSKTQTRRVVKPQPPLGMGNPRSVNAQWSFSDRLGGQGPYKHIGPCLYGQPGTLLWVRESHKKVMVGAGMGYAPGEQYLYRADGELAEIKWRPSIHMPRWASRLTLEITDVRVQRLQDIREMDAYAEGIDTEGYPYLAAEHGKLGGAQGPAASVCAYADLWDSINGPGSWEANPWVWALTFNVHQVNIDKMPGRVAA